MKRENEKKKKKILAQETDKFIEAGYRIYLIFCYRGVWKFIKNLHSRRFSYWIQYIIKKKKSECKSLRFQTLSILSAERYLTRIGLLEIIFNNAHS